VSSEKHLIYRQAEKYYQNMNNKKKPKGEKGRRKNSIKKNN